MTYQGARARPAASEIRRVFAVTKVRLDASGQVTDVLWSEINPRSNLNVGAQVVTPVADVVDAIHDGAQVAAVFEAPHARLPEHLFQVVERADGSETIILAKPSGHTLALPPDLRHMARLND